MDKFDSCYVAESEQRQADVKQLILLHVAQIRGCSDEEVIDASVKILAAVSRRLQDDLNNHFLKETQDRSLFDEDGKHARYQEAKFASSVMWNGLDIKEKVAKILKDRDLLDATLSSARASTLAADAARITAIWTRWMVIATAAAAMGTAVSAYYTMKSAQASQQSSCGQAVQQQVPHQSPVGVGKPK
jgi:hypothetical protein